MTNAMNVTFITLCGFSKPVDLVTCASFCMEINIVQQWCTVYQFWYPLGRIGCYENLQYRHVCSLLRYNTQSNFNAWQTRVNLCCWLFNPNLSLSSTSVTDLSNSWYKEIFQNVKISPYETYWISIEPQ